jgi:2,4-dienoyl-CoA reductase (NADPH2)
MEFIKLFQPININGKLEVKNRIVLPALGLDYTRDYSFTEKFAAFYRARAHGGVGLMTVGPIAVDEVGGAPSMPQLFDDKNVEPLRQFIDEMHSDTDVKVGTQLFHMGRYSYAFLWGKEPIAPSAIASKLTKHTPREMTYEDIQETQQAFADAATRCAEAGFDYVEIIACTGYLISEFLSPLTNWRTDEYGGSLENRMRFGVETVAKVRKAVGDDIAVGVRIAGNDFMDGGNTNTENAEFAAAAQTAGVDAVNVTGGWHETTIPQLTTDVPPGVYTYLARGVKDRVDVPVFASNRLGNPYLAEKTLRSGAADMICWARPIIADPELPNKVKEGRLDEIVTCIACNQGCFDAVFSQQPVRCVLNPLAGRENEYDVGSAAAAKKVMVAGGGPAGMEFAVTAAQRGHDVTLYEKDDCLGGQINLACVPPGKAEFHNMVESLEKRMAHNGVKVELGTPVTAETVAHEEPDVLVVASGARELEINVPGVDKPHVVSAWDLLADRVADIGENVVVVGGSATGCESAHFVASMGTVDPETFTFLMYHAAEDTDFAKELLHQSQRNITIIDLLPRLAENVGKTSRWSLMKRLRLSDVELRPNTKLLEITDDAVLVETEDGNQSIPADTVIMAVGAVPVDELTREVGGNGVEVITIGDAKEPRKISDAILEGFEAAVNL